MKYKGYEIEVKGEKIVAEKQIDGQDDIIEGVTVPEVKKKIDKAIKVIFERIDVYHIERDYEIRSKNIVSKMTLTSFNPEEDSARYKEKGNTHKMHSWDFRDLVPVTEETLKMAEELKSLLIERESIEGKFDKLRGKFPYFDIRKHAKAK
jgi:hypothetical protein